MMRAKAAKQYVARLDEHSDIIRRDMRLIRSIVGNDQELLDIGCGVGSFLSEYKEQLAVGVDISQDAILWCKNNGLYGAVADGRCLPFSSKSFGLVRSKEVLEHILDPMEMVREMKRVLCADGLLVCHVPTQFSMLYPLGANFFDDYTHIRPFSKQGIERLLKDGGFRILRTEGYTSPKDWWQRPIAPILSF